MQKDSALNGPSCASTCATLTSIEELNRRCYCLSTNNDQIRRNLETDLQRRGISDNMTTTHPHLFASVPMFISRVHLDRMSRVISAVEAVIATTYFQAAALAWAPHIARFDPGSRGGLLGCDFHLSVAGPQLIEINTNPGGALLNTVLGRAQESCC